MSVDTPEPGPGAPLAALVSAAEVVAATAGRNAKRDALAALLVGLQPDEVPVAVGLLVGEPRQGRVGVGWRTFAAATAVQPADSPSLSIADLDRLLEELAQLSGPGSGRQRHLLLHAFTTRATESEVRFLGRLLGGELRQGALAGVMTEAIARAADVPAASVRRAAMLHGDLAAVARVAVSRGRDGLSAVSLRVGRPAQPMLASTAPSVAAAVAEMGDSFVDWKLDGIRIQVQRPGNEVQIFTRNLNEITSRLPEIAAAVRAMAADALVLDGEALAMDGGRPVAFQDTSSRVGADAPNPAQVGTVHAWYFDLLHLNGEDLIDRPLHDRRAALEALCGDAAIPTARTADPDRAAAALEAALGTGHEGVVVKGAGSPYEAGRRGKAWRKVKPVHTFDLVVLAVEHGHGRRQGWLSNLHLGARSGDDFVMVGKTFKGLTDELLRWQTEALSDLATGAAHPEGDHVVTVRPELVVEIAVDGIQRSTRYPGGLALRFARVVRYRPDKAAAYADTLDRVRKLSRE